MLEATLNRKTREANIKSIYGDARPAVSPAENLPKIKNIQNPLAAFSLNNSSDLGKKNYRKDIFDTLLAKDYAKLDQKPDNPVVLNRIGVTYLQSGKLDKAIRFFKKAHLKNPNFLSAAQNLAHAYLLAGKLDEALGVYEELLTISSNNDAILHEYSFVRLLKGEPQEARKLLKQVKSDFPRYFEVRNTLGLISLSLSEKVKAKEYFEESKELNPDYAHPWNNIGAVYKEDGDNKKAKEYFNKAIELDPNYLVAHFNLFEIQVAEEDFKAALEHISSIQYLAPVSPEVQFKKAWVLMKMGSMQKALAEYISFLEIFPNSSAALNNIGHCYVTLGRPDMAIAYFRKANEVDKTNYMPVHNLMLMLNDTGKHIEAKQIAEQVVRNKVEDDAAHYALAGYWIEKEEWDKAEEELNKAIELKTTIDNVYANLAFILTDIRKDYKAATSLLEKRYKDGSREFSVINNLAHAYLRASNIAKAKKFVDMLSEIPHPVGLATTALYNLNMGNLEKAKELYSEAIKAMHQKYKHIMRQQYHYDLGLYFLQKKQESNAKDELLRAASYEKAKMYIRDEALELLSELSDDE